MWAGSVSPCWAPGWVGTTGDEIFSQIMMASLSAKRKYKEIEIAESTPKFLILERKEGNFEKTSMILIYKSIEGLVGKPKSLKKLKSGLILVETNSSKQADTLLSQIVELSGIPVKFSLHRSLNSSKGVIKSPNLKYADEKEILEELAPQGAIEVNKIFIKKDDKKIPTGTHIIKFNSTKLPTSVSIISMKIHVEPFIPNPTRCFNCQRFGHFKSNCTRPSVCAKCGEKHEGESCQSPAKCVNCFGQHPSFSKQCPKFIQEKQVQKVKIAQNITFPEARKIVEAQCPTGQKSYASAVGAPKPVSTSSVAIQTDPLPGIPPLKTLSKNRDQNPPKETNTPKPKNKSFDAQTNTPKSTTTQQQKTPSKSTLPSEKPQITRLPRFTGNKSKGKIIAQSSCAPLAAMEAEDGHYGSRESLGKPSRFSPLMDTSPPD